MVRLRHIFLSTCAILMGMGAAYAARDTDPPKGANEKLSIRFQVEGGKKWCSPGVRVKLQASQKGRNGAMEGNTEEFQQMLGRIRAIIQSECPQVRNIGFFGKASNGADLTTGESSEITGWRYVRFPSGGHYTCTGPLDQVLCSQRWASFSVARSMFINEGYSQIKLVRFLDTKEGADIEFVYGNASGRVAYIATETGIPFTQDAELVTWQVIKMREQCSGTAETTELERLDGGGALQGVRCRAGADIRHSYVLARKTASGFELVAFSDFTENGRSAVKLAEKLRGTINGTPSKVLTWDEVKSDSFQDIGYSNFVASPCMSAVTDFGTLDDHLVALRLQPVKQNDASQLVLRVYQPRNAKGAEDRWRMRLASLPRAERQRLEANSLRGAWLVFKVVQDPNDWHLENRLFMINADDSCTPVGTSSNVSVEQMPQRAVELYAEGLGFHPENAGEWRGELTTWLDYSALDTMPVTEAYTKVETPALPIGQYPIPLLEKLSRFHSECEQTYPGSSLTIDPSFGTSADIDGDGDMDFIATGDALSCETATGAKHLIGGGNGGTNLWVVTTESGVHALTLDTFAAHGEVRRHKGFATFSDGQRTWRIAGGSATEIFASPKGGEAVYILSR